MASVNPYKTTKNFFLLILLLSNLSNLQAQSLLKLDTSTLWRVAIGDSLTWKKPDFDDSHWQISPPPTVLYADSLLALPTGTRWFRTYLSIDSSQIDYDYALETEMVGACEVYLNGLKVGKIGYLGNKRVYRITFRPNKIATLYFEKPGKYLLAIRYTYPDLQAWYETYHWKNYFTGFRVNITSERQKKALYYQIMDASVSYFGLGLLAFLLVAYTAVLSLKARQIESIITIGILLIYMAMCMLIIWVDLSKTLTSALLLMKSWPVVFCIVIVGQAYVHFLVYDRKRHRLFWSVIGCTIISFVVLFIDLGYGFRKHSYVLYLVAVILQFPLPFYLMSLLHSKFKRTTRWKTTYRILFLLLVLVLIKASIASIAFPPGFAIFFFNSLLVIFSSILRIIYTNRRTIYHLNKKLIEVQELSAEKQTILAQQNILLEQRVAQRTSELQESNRSKNLLFSIVSHDLRSPLLSLKTLLEMLQDQTIDKKQFDKLSSYLTNKLSHLDTTLENLLTWALSQMNTIQTNPETLAIEPVIEDSISLYENNALLKNISFVRQITTDIEAHIDKNHLQIILRNLIQNAIKFSPFGGAIGIAAMQANDFIELRITNVSNKQNSDLVATPAVGFGKGTSLGLLVCRELAERNNSQISIDDGEKQQIVVTLKIPKW